MWLHRSVHLHECRLGKGIPCDPINNLCHFSSTVGKGSEYVRNHLSRGIAALTTKVHSNIGEMRTAVPSLYLLISKLLHLWIPNRWIRNSCWLCTANYHGLLMPPRERIRAYLHKAYHLSAYSRILEFFIIHYFRNLNIIGVNKDCPNFLRAPLLTSYYHVREKEAMRSNCGFIIEIWLFWGKWD